MDPLAFSVGSPLQEPGSSPALGASSPRLHGLGLCGHMRHGRSLSQASIGTATGTQTPSEAVGEGSPSQRRAELVQTLSAPGDGEGESVLALAHTPEHVIGGTQSGRILAWRRSTYRLEHTRQAHAGGCLALVLGPESVVFSAGADGRVCAWDAETLEPLYDVLAAENSGAVLSLAYVAERDVLVLGCQNTSLQLFDVGRRLLAPRDAVARELAARRSRFFDDPAAPLTVCASNACTETGLEAVDAVAAAATAGSGAPAHVVATAGVIDFAHSGYVYSVVAGSLPGGQDAVFSGGGDGAVNVWVPKDGAKDGVLRLEQLVTLEAHGANDSADACVLALALGDDGLLFAGLQSGGVAVWDLETMQLLRVLGGGGGGGGVAALLFHRGCVFAAGGDGRVRVWGPDLQRIGALSDSGGEVLLALAATGAGQIACGGRAGVAVWHAAALVPEPAPGPALPQADSSRMLHALTQWVRLRSVAGVEALQPECRRAARFLRDLMRQLGASDSRLLAGAPGGGNALVYGRFDPPGFDTAQLARDAPTVFVYGHYDVMPAGDAALWQSPPFELHGRDGFLYARGASDDKGPVLAMLFAAAELHAARRLRVPIVFCIEGEEERGSPGLRDALVRHRALLGAPRLVLLSSAYWLGEATPCLTYGMRGAIRASVRVESSRAADVHSGVWGGAVAQPLACLARMLTGLVDPAGRVLIPGFHDAVRPVLDAEGRAMRDLVAWITSKEAHAPLVARTAASPPTQADASTSTSTGADSDDQTEDHPSTCLRLYDQLMQRWRFPALTVHHVDVSTGAAPTNATLVPAAAEAKLSVRVVPDQSLEEIVATLRAHLEDSFRASVLAAGGPQLLDALTLRLDVQPIANWWLADPDHPLYRAAAQAIRDEWAPGADGVPLLIREGGSIPAVPLLEQFFAPHAVAVNLPMGQSSDNAHLDNERISLENLVRGRQVVYRLLDSIGDLIVQGKLRLAKWYTTLSPKQKTQTIKQITSLVLSRKPKQCNFIEHNDTKVVYRKYASLYFISGIGLDDNELIQLEIIHRYVEVLDRFFGNVCELDLIFNFQKAYWALDEMIVAGELLESSKKAIGKVLAQMEEQEAVENAERGWGDINLEGVARTALLSVQELRQALTR
ncbi:hypothetical protein GGI07_004502 [Coemansia sp. Benny D115]|nr:hypothetical protein GGI07_004502 [Coemansia sp. Benny D115]